MTYKKTSERIFLEQEKHNKKKSQNIIKKSSIYKDETPPFVKIKDGTIIRRESLEGYHKEKYNVNGVHYYIALYNENKKNFDMYPTSHYIDPKKETDVKKGRAIKMKIRGMDQITTVYKVPRKNDIHGQPFRKLTDKTKVIGYLTPNQQKKLIKFLDKK